jgi:hypothetical protein
MKKQSIFDIDLQLIGQDGNAFMILGLAQKAAHNAGIDKDEIMQYMNEAMDGDYNHLLSVTTKYFNVY